LSGEDKKNDEVKKKENRFYEPKNWDRKLTIEDPDGSGSSVYCGQCGHIIYDGDSFCTKCGSEVKK